MKQPIFLYPAFKDYLWGGTGLKAVYPACDQSPLAEAWVLSCHPDGQSTVAGEDTSLSQLLAAHPEMAGTKGNAFPFFPVLIKLIDAEKELSVQVHPEDKYAMEAEGGFGKTEMWYVLDCKPGATLYYGFTHEISKEEFAARIQNNTLTDVLKAVPVHKGDVFFIPAGTIHAIGAGILIAEIQQNSNTTYRVYDYGRLGADGKPRDLHIQKALDVTDLTPAPQNARTDDGVLADCQYFKVESITAPKTDTVTRETFHALLAVNGGGTLTVDGVPYTLKQFDCVFLPAELGDYTLNPDGEILKITV